MIGDFFKAVAQLGDPRFRRVFGISIALTLGLLGILYFLWLRLTTGAAAPGDFLLFGMDLGFLDPVLEVLAWVGGFLALGFLMMPVAALFIGMFLEQIADAVEAKHYPHARGTRHIGMGEMAWDGVLFTLTLLGANLVALFIYLLVAPLAPFIFLAVNGWLLGRQYYELVAARHVGFREARRARKAAGIRVWIAGVLMAIPLSIPIVGLVIPVLGVAAFTHMHHRIARPGGAIAA